MNDVSSGRSNESPENTNPQGYRKKPLWIYLIAFILMLSPFGNFLWSLVSLGTPEWYKPSIWFAWARFIDTPTWVLLSLLFSSGLSLLFVRRWSWTYSVVVIGIIVAYDIVMFKHFLDLGPGAAIAMITLTVSFALILYFSEFRQPYLNPRLRWWETSPRYKVDLPASLSKFEKAGVIVDISRSGLLIEWPADVNVPTMEGPCEITLLGNLKLNGMIRRQTPRGYGVQFEQITGEQKKGLMKLLETLKSDPSKLAR